LMLAYRRRAAPLGHPIATVGKQLSSRFFHIKPLSACRSSSSNRISLAKRATFSGDPGWLLDLPIAGLLSASYRACFARRAGRFACKCGNSERTRAWGVMSGVKAWLL
jgi:hypothetical protein